MADSGTNYDVFKEREIFETLQPASGKVLLGYGEMGIGAIKFKIGDHILRAENVCYIPDLTESICNLFIHIQHPQHGLHSSFEKGLYIVFPEFQTKALLGTDDIYLDAIPATSTYDCHNSVCSQNYISGSDCILPTNIFVVMPR